MWSPSRLYHCPVLYYKILILDIARHKYILVWGLQFTLHTPNLFIKSCATLTLSSQSFNENAGRSPPITPFTPFRPFTPLTSFVPLNPPFHLTFVSLPHTFDHHLFSSTTQTEFTIVIIWYSLSWKWKLLKFCIYTNDFFLN